MSASYPNIKDTPTRKHDYQMSPNQLVVINGKPKGFRKSLFTYKVMCRDGMSRFNRMDYTPWLPKNGRPGPWLPVLDRSLLNMCWRGYHTTKTPLQWGGEHKPGRTYKWQGKHHLYLVEIVGYTKYSDSSKKQVSRSFRFIKRLYGTNPKGTGK